MKKLIALVLALVMVLMVGASFAQTVELDPADTDNATITITNAAKGETYSIVKLFDATVSSDGKIAYQSEATIPTALAGFFEKDSSNNVTLKRIQDDNGKDPGEEGYVNKYYSLTSADYTTIKTWAESQTKTASATSDGTPLSFTKLPYGYYVVISSQGALVTVDSTKPNAEIRDKNTFTTEAFKTVNDENVYVGQNVTFTAKFGPLANWKSETANGISSDYQIKSYTIDDTLPPYLANVVITEVKVYDKDPAANDAVVKADLSSSYTAFTNKKIVIPWVNDANPAANIYPNKAWIQIKYTADITDKAVIDGNGNTNTVGITPNKDKTGDEPFNEHITADKVVKTYGAALVKVDGQDTTKSLKGAKFTVNGYEVVADANVTGVYHITGTKTGDSIEMSTDDNGALYILGMDDSLTLTETVAPAGYNKLTDTITLPKQILSKSIWTKEETRYFDAKGNLLTESINEQYNKTVDKNYTDLKPQAVKVINNAGTELPSTGGIGTTIFYVLGGLLVVGAAVILVARRKASN